MARRALLTLLSVWLVPLPAQSSSTTTRADLPDPPAAEGRLIVKYAPSVSRSAERVLAEHGRFESLTGSASLDELNQALGVRSARPLAFGRGDLAGARASSAYLDRLAAVRARFPQRAARAPSGAQAPDLSNVFVLEIDPRLDVHEAARRYAADPAVVYAHPDYQVQAQFSPDDPFFASSGTWGQSYEDLWGLHRTGAASAWDVSSGGGVVVAVVDTGIDPTHPDLQANLWHNPGEIAGNGIDDDGNGLVDDVVGWDFASDDADPTDLNGHGTHVAGTVAAVGNNGLGVIGMSWNAQVMAVRGLDAAGRGWSFDLAACILYAAENGADVINNSWGGFLGPSAIGDVISDAVATAEALGVVVVAAAGNQGVDLRLAGFPTTAWTPAGLPGVITVAASGSDDSVAAFSNYGQDITVSAPGLDVLSLRGRNSTAVGGEVVGTDYLRLSGTSMAAPHASGAAALLLSALPGLTVDEVRWHLELNADQPGYPGYEGASWNPRHGWGRINASRAFDPPPVTTRAWGELFPKHAFPDMLLPAGPEPFELIITTRAPTPWTVSGPAWLQAVPNAGSAGAPIAVSADTTGLSPGAYAGALGFDVPGAVDGGAAAPATLVVHRDERAGAEMVLGDLDALAWQDPRAASNGLGTLVGWIDYLNSTNRVAAVYVDAAGTPSAPLALAQDIHPKEHLWVATDGSGYVVIWSDLRCTDSRCSRLDNDIMLMRLGPQGEALDAEPILLGSGKESQGFHVAGVGFDGEAYSILFAKGLRNARYSVLRLGRDGALVDKARPVGHYPLFARFACATGSCLLSWSEIAGTTPGGFYVYQVRSVQIVGTHVVDPTPRSGPSPFFFPSSLVSDGTSYLLLGQQHLLCDPGTGETICREDAVGARLAPDGSGLDAQSFPLNVDSPLDTLNRKPARFLAPGTTVFDGTAYLVPFALAAYSYTEAPKLIFLARVRPDGSLVDGEQEGLLIRPQWSNVDSTPEIAADALHALVVFRAGGPFDPSSVPHAIPVLAHAADPSFAAAAIGSIGPLTVDEGAVLRLALAAPGLDPATTTFAASGLPDGAHLDRATGLFSWRPNGSQRGAYPVRFEAADGVGTVGEDAVITVDEASLSIAGTARFTAGGLPAAGLAIKLSGSPAGTRTAYTDALGRFRFDDLTGGRTYRLCLTRPSSRLYLAAPHALGVTLDTADVAGLQFDISSR